MGSGQSPWDPDTPAAQLTFSADGLPAGLLCDPQCGLIHGELAADASGPHLVAVTVSNGQASAGAGFWLTVATPAAIELSILTVTPLSTSARVEWRTAREIDTVGYYLYRTTVGVGGGQEWVTISPLIPAQGEGGAHYQFEDHSVWPGVRY